MPTATPSPTRQKIQLLLLLAFAIGVAGWFAWKGAQPSQHDDFARCLSERGATFYGAFWCPHCQNQKKLFGKAQKHLNYVECSTADGKGQLPRCTQAGVESYPTWDFADETRLTGEISLEVLAEQTGCMLDS